MVKDLTSYGTGNGLKTWSLLSEINTLDDLEADRLLMRARRMAEVYGGYDETKPGFQALIVELIYNLAENLYYAAQAVPSLATPFRAERIGSYSYDKGAREQRRDFVRDSDVIMPLIIYLKDNRGPMRYGTRIEHVLPANPETGIRDIVHSTYSNRVARAIECWGYISDTEDFNSVVYGDGIVDWP